MDTDLKVSVVIPAYNSAKFIENALQSIISQTSPIDEIIVVDDGSSDNTVETVLSFKKKNKLVHLQIIEQPNSGPSKARNTAIEKCSGDYIAFLDSDDEWHAEKIEMQKYYAKRFPEVAIICSEMDEPYSDPKTEFSFISFGSALWKNYFYTSTMMIKTDVLKKYKFDEKQRYSEDYKLYLQIVRDFPALRINRKLIDYNRHVSARGASLSSNLWQMEKGELRNYKFLYLNKDISFIKYIAVSTFSVCKYYKRIITS